MNEEDKILLKLHYKAKREAIRELLKEFKDNDRIVKKLKEMQDKLPVNV
ncbi:MAG: hypothetical protein ABIH65_03870 [Nanoarchaeota archaeon]